MATNKWLPLLGGWLLGLLAQWANKANKTNSLKPKLQ